VHFIRTLCAIGKKKSQPHILAHLVFANKQSPPKKTKRAKISPRSEDDDKSNGFYIEKRDD